MEPNVAKLLIGLTVKISRSDGRVHNAKVRTINPNMSLVHVEWNEDNGMKGKEIDVNDLFKLNADIMAYVQASDQTVSSRTTTPNPVSEDKEEAKEEPPKRSKIPASLVSAPSPKPAEESASRRMTTRQTCMFRPPPLSAAGGMTDAVPELASSIVSKRTATRGMTSRQTCMFRPSPSSAPGGITDAVSDLTSSVVSRPTGLPSYTRKQAAKHSSNLQPTSETVAASEAIKSAPVAAANQRLSVGPDMHKSSTKRMSMSRGLEKQMKKGKYGDMHRPNKQFYQMIEEFRESVEIVPLTLEDPVKLQKICVCVRKRPLNKKEISRKEIDVVTIPGNGVLLFHEPKQKVDLTKYLDNQQFNFDYSFDDDSSNDLVYRFSARPLVKTIFEGGRATCFAYGQTGSGKTHTMGGDFSGKAQNSAKGIYALAAQDVFNFLQWKKYTDLGLCPYVTFFEIYNGKVFDLLNKKTKLRVLEDENQQVQVVGLQEIPVSSVDDVIRMIEKGSACRTSGQTFANTNSSRSHAVLQVILRQGNLLHGKFSLVDLAGNERGTDVSSNDRQTMVETAEINRSLLALKECIRSLGQNSEHIPFRMSKLTQVLRDSFIGENSRTCMIAMISPGMNSCDYTLNTLRYADRVKELNGIAKGMAQMDMVTDVSLEPSSPDSEESLTEELEIMTKITEEEERFYEALQCGSLLAKDMEDASYEIINSLPDIGAYMERLQASYQNLKSAVDALKVQTPNLAS